LLLLAAANETALITHLTEALPAEQAEGRPPLVGSSAAARQRLLLTLLFLGAVGLHRTWELRGYMADGLALLTGCRQAYGYRYTEAFLAYGKDSFPGQPFATLKPQILLSPYRSIRAISAKRVG
jgi:hypothetical protein